MPGDPRLRASDADRERAAELLREHHAVGRLTAEEFDGRLEGVFTARTRGELDDLLADLPAIDLYQLPSAAIRPVARRRNPNLVRPAGGPLVPGLTPAWITWAAAGGLAVAVWAVVGLVTGGAAWIPWFLLVIIPWWVALERRRRHDP